MHYDFQFIHPFSVNKRVEKYILRLTIIMHCNFGFIHSLSMRKVVKKSRNWYLITKNIGI